MITLDKLRDALRQPQPWTAMDELVRAEQAAGRKVKEIYDELRALVEPVRALDNPPEDADDAMMDTLDALVGYCRPDSAYRDPPNTSLPTEEEIAQLPRRARIALIARCARRLLPLFKHRRPDATEELTQTVSRAIKTAEQGVYLDYINARVADAVRRSTNDAAAATAVSVAAAAAAANADAVHGIDDIHRDTAAIHAAAIRGDIRSYIRRDFDMLVRIAAQGPSADYTTVPPEVFGPLWPEGPPQGWPADPDTPQRTELPLAFVAREGVLPVVLEDEVVNLFNALNQYYALRTGDRLTVDGDIHTFLAALSPAGVS